MKICVMSGAIKNAGDYLITERCEKLIKYAYPDVEIIRVIRNHPIGDRLELVNGCDYVVFAGGPGYRENIYPGVFPLVDDLNKIKPPMMYIGGGIGANGSYYLEEDFKREPFVFTNDSRMFLDRIVKDTGVLSCRDWNSVRVLQANGYEKVLMTGCPAWYNLDSIGIHEVSKEKKQIRKICVSDPAAIRHHGVQVLDLLGYLKEKFADAQITYVMHKGAEHEIAKRLLEDIHSRWGGQINCIEIADSAEGFQVYDDCDLHIGFRVHAHIYNLSIRNRTILIEEDVRGSGVNAALGLWKIGAEEWRPQQKGLLRYFDSDRNKRVLNKQLIPQVDQYLNNIIFSNDAIFASAFRSIDSYFENMKSMLGLIKQND